MNCPDPLERSYRLALALATICDSMVTKPCPPGDSEYVAWSLALELTNILDEARSEPARRFALSTGVDVAEHPQA
jgi:hypothetical protein